MSTPAQRARNLYNSISDGVLSTMSEKLEGYPFGSVVPYSTDELGRPVIYVSLIAEHTKNMKQNSRASLLVRNTEVSDAQAGARLILTGDMQEVNEADTGERYFKHFPNSRMFAETHDFIFFRLELKAVRYIAGFGDIHWLTPDEFQVKNPFFGEDEARIIEHMNADHRESLLGYCRTYENLDVSLEDTVKMCGVDGEGFSLLLSGQKLRFVFPEPVQDPEGARKALIEMARGK